MKENTSTCKRGDCIITKNGNKETLVHSLSRFAPVHRDTHNPLDSLVEIYRKDKNGLCIMLETSNIYYFVVASKTVLGQPYDSFDKAVEMLDYWTEHYSDWVKQHNMKGISKKQFLDGVKAGKLNARLVYTNMKRRETDNLYWPLSKTQGRGSVDIVRNGKASAIFYIDSLPARQMVYTGDKLKIFSPGYRLYNEKEMACVLDWEKQRDRKAEWLDAISDGSQEYYRKKHFFESRDCAHLRIQPYRMIVKDNNIRQDIILEYDIKKS